MKVNQTVSNTLKMSNPIEEATKAKEMDPTNQKARNVAKLKEDLQPKLEKLLRKDQTMAMKNLHFYTHEESGKIIVDVIDRDSGEVLKSIPEPEIVDMMAQLKESTGVLLDVQG